MIESPETYVVSCHKCGAIKYLTEPCPECGPLVPRPEAIRNRQNYERAAYGRVLTDSAEGSR